MTKYLGKTSTGLIVKRASTRNDYVFASVELTRPEGYKPGRRQGRRWVGNDAFGAVAIEHGPVVDLRYCHFSTTRDGALKLIPKGYTGEVVEVQQVDDKTYAAALKA
jgi:hypothetical protein